MALQLLRVSTFTETQYIEGGKACDIPLRLFAAAAIIKNPWHGQGFIEDLKPEIYDVAPQLGKMLTETILDMAGGGETVEGYGKAAMVGTSGEVEHASAIIHTLRFGNYYRNAVQAESYLSFTNVRSGPGGTLMIPLMHKNDAGMRSHYLTVQFAMPDAPAHDELVIALGASVGGRPHHRIGDRYQDIADLGDNTAIDAS